MENVPQLMNQAIYARFKENLSKAGYRISDGVVACSDFEVPQISPSISYASILIGQH